MSDAKIFTVGGTVQAGQGIYITRESDETLFELCQQGTLAYVLTARQVGKSSTMIHAAQRLGRENIATVILDLTKIGVERISADQWYLGIITEIADHLRLPFDPIGWWQQHGHLSMSQRLANFFEDQLLQAVKSRIVIFVDEIDSTLSLPFTDDFFAVVRYIHNSRATKPELARLSFVLLGVATPSDLISDPNRTPFNVGQRVDLTDFTLDELMPLAKGFNLSVDHARNLLADVYRWTSGHPYLTQRLCNEIAAHERTQSVDTLVKSTFFGEKADQDSNLQFIRDMLIKRSPDTAGVLGAYRQILQGHRAVPDDEQSVNKTHLKLSGLVIKHEDRLIVRNRIYTEIFDKTWIREHIPINWARRSAIGMLAVISLLIIAIVFLFTREPKTAPVRGFRFERPPIDIAETQWFQYYGNTVWAYTETGNSLKYAQYLHGGIDFGRYREPDIPVYAGLNGIFDSIDESSFAPYRVTILAGDYLVIYGHLKEPVYFEQGTPITPNTVIGYIGKYEDPKYAFSPHVHLEVRLGGTIINPLEFFPESLRNMIFLRFPPDDQFYESASWQLWLEPLDQPEIQLGGPIIGPKS